MRLNKLPLMRNSEAGHLFELFLVNSIASIIVIRVFLHLTGYPQLGGGGLHIAHMLWGGLLMLVSISILLFYLESKMQVIAAIIGGLGFGTFIDELGKFITSDNDYFFQPTFALIYVIFILFYFIFRWIIKSHKMTDDEYFGNYLEMLQDSIVEKIDPDKLGQMREFLKESSLPGDTKKLLSKLTNKVRVKKADEDGLYTKAKLKLKNYYRIIISHKKFPKLLVGIFIIWALFTLGYLLYLVLAVTFRWRELLLSGDIERIVDSIYKFGFFEWGSIITSIIVFAFIVVGIRNVKKDFLTALMWFRRAVLISLFFGQFFSFFHNQLLAFLGVVPNILLYYSIEYMVRQEKGFVKTFPK